MRDATPEVVTADMLCVVLNNFSHFSGLDRAVSQVCVCVSGLNNLAQIFGICYYAVAFILT